MLNLIVFLMLLTGCTYSVNMIHTSGVASDVVDENQSASPDVSPTVSLPLAAGHPVNYPPQDPRGANGPAPPC